MFTGVCCRREKEERRGITETGSKGMRKLRDAEMKKKNFKSISFIGDENTEKLRQEHLFCQDLFFFLKSSSSVETPVEADLVHQR